MSRSDAEHLEFLKLARDQVTDAIAERRDATTVTLGSKSVEYKARDAVLDSLHRQIMHYQKQVNRASGKAARNRIRLRKGLGW